MGGFSRGKRIPWQMLEYGKLASSDGRCRQLSMTLNRRYQTSVNVIISSKNLCPKLGSSGSEGLRKWIAGLSRSKPALGADWCGLVRNTAECENPLAKCSETAKFAAGRKAVGFAIISSLTRDVNCVTRKAAGTRRVSTSVIGNVVNRQIGVNELLKHYGRCYWELSKVRLSLLVVSTASVGYVMASGEVVNWAGLAWTSLGTFLAASSANAINQVLEVTNDASMMRTRRRPLPAGRLSRRHALAWALSTGLMGVTLLAWKANLLTAELGAANILLYTLIYTPLKQIHACNTWIGAVVGAIPPLMGWSAATGTVDAGAWVLASALYFWQIPHFMALAFLCRNDYSAGGYKMMSLLDSSGRRTALVALRNCVYMVPLGFAAQYLGTTTGFFGLESVVLAAGLSVQSALFYCKPTSDSARRLFRASLMYLPIFMAAMVLHRIPRSSLEQKEDMVPENGERQKTSQSRNLSERHKRPPIALVSAAPFPFLPAPEYY